MDQCGTDSDLSSLNQSCTITKAKEILNASTVLKCTVMHDQSIKEHWETPLVKPCSVVVDKLSADECFKLISGNKETGAVKFQKKRNTILKSKKNLVVNEVCGKNICKTSTVSPKFSLQSPSYNFNCSVFIERIDVAECLRKMLFNGQHKFRKQPEKLIKFKQTVNNKNNYRHICKGKREKGYLCEVCERILETPEGLMRHTNIHNFLLRKNSPEFVPEMQLREEGTSKCSAKEMIMKAKSCSPERTAVRTVPPEVVVRTVPPEAAVCTVPPEAAVRTVPPEVAVPTVPRVVNRICSDDYLCAQCFQNVKTDEDLYHHICKGKRQKGYLCEFCEKTLETPEALLRHTSIHYLLLRDSQEFEELFDF